MMNMKERSVKVSLTEICEKYEKENGYNNPLPLFVYDFLFKHYDDPMDVYNPMDIVDCLFADRIDPDISKLPTGIQTCDFRYDGFVRYPIPMVVVDGMKDRLWWNCLVPVSISESPKILISDDLLRKRSNLSHDEWDKVFKFISKNHEILLDQWHCQIEEKYGISWNDIDSLWKLEK